MISYEITLRQPWLCTHPLKIYDETRTLRGNAGGGWVGRRPLVKEVFRPHRSTTCRPSSVVCLSVSRSACNSSEPCKNGWTHRDAVWCVDSGRLKEPCIRWGPDPCMGRGNFKAARRRSAVKYSDALPWPVQNGWTDRDAVWDLDLDGPKEACIRWAVYTGAT